MYSIIIIISILGMILLINANELIIMYLSIELQSLSLYILATISRNNKDKLESISSGSGLKYFIIGSISTGMVLLSLSLIYYLTGSSDINSIKNIIESDTEIKGIIDIIIIIGLIIKIGGAPFHNWIGDVYSGVKIKVTMILNTMPKISLIVLIIIIISILNDNIITELIYIISIISIIVGTIMALNVKNIKKLIIYSSISQIGIILIIINSIIIKGGIIEERIYIYIFYIIQYIITNILVMGIINIMREDIKNIYELRGYSGLIKLSLLIGIFSLTGIPPLIGFYGKQLILSTLLNNGLYLLSILIIMGSMLSSGYYIKLIKILYLEKGNLREDIKINKINSYIIGLLTLLISIYWIKPNILLIWI